MSELQSADFATEKLERRQRQLDTPDFSGQRLRHSFGAGGSHPHLRTF